MISISHRGYWLTSAEKNTEIAFKRSFHQGFGTELDIRDYKGDLVISHDIPNEESFSFKRFLNLFTDVDHTLPLALNIKSDGLASKINEYLQFYNIQNYFCFDMSIPDTLSYIKNNMNIYMRRSEYESENELFQCAKGIWIDSFKDNNFQITTIHQYLHQEKSLCIVSPELHHRDETQLWYRLKHIIAGLPSSEKIMLCTDKLDQASEYFNDHKN